MEFEELKGVRTLTSGDFLKKQYLDKNSRL